MSFWQPTSRIAPQARPVFGDSQVEALALERHCLGVSLQKREGETVRLLEALRCSQVDRREIDANWSESCSGKPRADGSCPAAELDNVRAWLQPVHQSEL